MSDTERSSEDVERAMSSDVLATLVENHREFLGFLERKVGSRAVAEDILQEAFVRGIDRLDSLRSDESVKAWFYRTLRNAVVDHFRRKGSSARALAALAVELDGAHEEAVEAERVVCQCVRTLASTLKPEYAAALQRVEVDGISVQAFAEEAAITPNNAAVRLFRAREALRKRVATACGSCAEHGCLDCSCAAPADEDAPARAGGCGHAGGH